MPSLFVSYAQTRTCWHIQLYMLILRSNVDLFSTQAVKKTCSKWVLFLVHLVFQCVCSFRSGCFFFFFAIQSLGFISSSLIGEGFGNRSRKMMGRKFSLIALRLSSRNPDDNIHCTRPDRGLRAAGLARDDCFFLILCFHWWLGLTGEPSGHGDRTLIGSTDGFWSAQDVICFWHSGHFHWFDNVDFSQDWLIDTFQLIF